MVKSRERKPDMELSKGQSPFYPGQPVPVELFVGRQPQIQRIGQRGVGQVMAGKPVAVFVQGEYGIGKSSIARYTQAAAELGTNGQSLYGIYATIGGAKSIQDVTAFVLEAAVRAGAYEHTKAEKVRNWLAKYVSKTSLFGVEINTQALRADAPELSSPMGMLRFLTELLERLKDTGTRGLFLVLDEINGITADPQFAQFIKGLVDTNAMSSTPLPLLLMLCGTEERRRDMIQKHQSVDRIFDVIDIERMSDEEMTQFFTQAFASVNVTVNEDAMHWMARYSAGFPKIMHIVGDSVFWENTDEVISIADAVSGVFDAADEVGKKFVDQQVLAALRSPTYQSILKKIAQLNWATTQFTRADIATGLTDTERKGLDNFLRKMVQLNVIHKGEAQGEYVFNLALARMYIYLQSAKDSAA